LIKIYKVKTYTIKTYSSKLTFSKPSTFTLIELLIVIAIFVTLATMLQPTLKRTLASAHTLTCLNHEKGIGLASAQYLEDHNSYFVAAGSFNQTTRSYDALPWDTNLAGYMGRENHTKKWRAGRESADGFNPQNNILRCPSDEIQGGAGWERASYSMNGRASTQPDAHNWGPATAMGEQTLFDVANPTTTFLFTERPSWWNLINYNGRSLVPNTGSQTNAQEGTHGPFTFNYLFLDGHARMMLQSETATNYPDWRNLGMWSINPDD